MLPETMKNFEAPSPAKSETSPQEVEDFPKPAPERRGGDALSKIKETIESTRENVSAFVRQTELKVKEYFGWLKQEEFEELLDLDFQEQLKDNPPIEGVFWPEEELTKIREMPRAERKEALPDFKEKLAKQREAWASCRMFIERGIEFDHDVPKGRLTDLIEKFGGHYGFTEEQKQIAEGLIDGYYTNRQRVLEIRERYSDNIALVNELVGINFSQNEKFDISVGPMTIDIGTDGFTAGRIYERSDNPVAVFNSGGFLSRSTGEKPVYFIVVNQDTQRRLQLLDISGKETRNHEYEHAKHKLFRVAFERPFGEEERINLLQKYELQRDSEIKKAALEDYLRFEQRKALDRARDEITACLCERSVAELQHKLSQIFFSGQGGPYDYLEFVRNYAPKGADSLYQETSQRMLVREYRAVIEKAVGSFAELTREGKYSTQEAIALLTDKSLSDWPKTARRLLEQKMEKK